MTLQATTVKESFLQLPKKEQLELMHYFLQALTASTDAVSEDAFVLSDAWKKELDARDEAYKNGTSKAIPLQDALARFDV